MTYANSPIKILSCVVFRVPKITSIESIESFASDLSDGSIELAGGQEDVMLALPHHPGRLPIRLAHEPNYFKPIVWHRFDGQVEQLGIGRDHSDWFVILNEIKSHGLLVSEFDPADNNARELSSWILSEKGSSIDIAANT